MNREFVILPELIDQNEPRANAAGQLVETTPNFIALRRIRGSQTLSLHRIITDEGQLQPSGLGGSVKLLCGDPGLFALKTLDYGKAEDVVMPKSLSLRDKMENAEI
ncbi:MAG: hypothetical protein KF868_11850, partial [Acidobacteria bacterium]|nr:hypothetical protein [Acidobacteriota bacterium]